MHSAVPRRVALESMKGRDNAYTSSVLYLGEEEYHEQVFGAWNDI